MTAERSVKSIVLYADDDSDDIQFVADAFYKFAKNVELVTVSDGLEALAYLKNLLPGDPAPCLIILDINMPRMNGKEALTKIRQMERFEGIPSILFTTSSQLRDQDFAKKYNAGFLTKPIDITQMQIIANTFIDHCSEETQKNIKRTLQ